MRKLEPTQQNKIIWEWLALLPSKVWILVRFFVRLVEEVVGCPDAMLVQLQLHGVSLPLGLGTAWILVRFFVRLVEEVVGCPDAMLVQLQLHGVSLPLGLGT